MKSENVKQDGEELAGLEQGGESEQIGQQLNNMVEHMKVKGDVEGSTVYKGFELSRPPCSSARS
jgi:hypothetical protein